MLTCTVQAGRKKKVDSTLKEALHDYFFLPAAYSNLTRKPLGINTPNYGRGESGRIGIPEVRGRGESGKIGMPLARSVTTGRGESGRIGIPEVFGRGESGKIGIPLANAMAAFVAATATIVMTKERNRRAFFDMLPPV
jgi:hypothetical protein